ncbi:MAG: GntR family transcriptional regulator [Pseudomonas sp.]
MARKPQAETQTTEADSSRTRALTVTELLRKRILDGDIPPETRLMELTLAAELGVSRTPVRDALTRLADEGLLLYQPNRGFEVRRFDSKDIYDAFSLRATLEAMACRLIGERGLSAEAKENLQTQLEKQHALLFGGEWGPEHALQWHDLNLDFHYTLLELADNPWLTLAVQRVRHLPIVFDSKSRPHDREALKLLYLREHSQQALADHRKIVDALVNSEFVRAEALMREHVLTNRDVILRELQRIVS